MSNGNFEKRLAGSVLRMQARGGGVPANVLAAAGRVQSGKGNNADVNELRQWRGITQTGASQSRSALKAASGAVGKAGQFAVLGSVAAGGGAGAPFAAAQVANMLSQEIEKASKSGTLARMIEGAFKRPAVARVIEDRIKRAALSIELNSAKRINELAAKPNRSPGEEIEILALKQRNRDAQKIRTSGNVLRAEATRLKALGPLSKMGERGGVSLADVQGAQRADTDNMLSALKLKDKIGRIGRIGAAAAQFGAFGYAATKFNVGLAEALGGMSGGEQLRLATSDARIERATTNNVRTQRMATLNEEMIKTQSRTNFIPVIGGMIGSVRTGAQAEEHTDLAIAEAVKNTGLTSDVTTDKVRDTALERVMREKYGVLGGHLGEKREALFKSMGITSATLEKEIEGAAVASINRAAGLKNQAMEAAAMLDFRGAAELLNQARSELPGSVPVWMNVDSMYKMQAERRASQKMFGRLQAPRSGPRTGD